MIEKLYAEDEEKQRLSLLPKEFDLSLPYPNPFNSSVQVNYSLPDAVNVNLSIYDINGRLVQNLINLQQDAGCYRTVWQGHDIPTGMYVLQLEAGEFIQTRQITLIK